MCDIEFVKTNLSNNNKRRKISCGTTIFTSFPKLNAKYTQYKQQRQKLFPTVLKIFFVLSSFGLNSWFRAKNILFGFQSCFYHCHFCLVTFKKITFTSWPGIPRVCRYDSKFQLHWELFTKAKTQTEKQKVVLRHSERASKHPLQWQISN